MTALTSMNSTRYLALDALRGFTIAMMILVNTPGSWSFVYPPLLHADWHGCTPTDLVFPFFLFVVGSAMYFALQKNSMAMSSPLVLMILRRALIIFALGLIFNGVLGGWQDLRIMGVLQRIAITYAIAALIVLSIPRSGVYWVSIALLFGYWLLLNTGNMENPYGLHTNIVAEIDMALLGAEHMYNGKGAPFDPEGLLSTLPAIVNVLIGFELTRFLVTQPDRISSVFILIALGAIGIVVGLIWSIWLPINKSLWTSSFVIYTAGYFCLALALFVWIVDIKKIQWLSTPFIIYGSNSIFIYMLAPFWVHAYTYIPINAADTTLYDGLFLQLEKIFPPAMASLSFALLHVILFWCISSILYRKKIFIRV